MWLREASGYPLSEKASKNEPVLTLTRLSDLLAEPIEQTPYVVQDMLPAGGTSTIVAKPKVGKTTTAQCIALAVAKGVSVLGRRTTPGAVVYICLEDKRAEVASHFRALGGTNEPIFIHTGRVPPTGVAIMQLEALIREHNAVLSVIDTLFRFVKAQDGNDYAAITNTVDPLIGVAHETGCHIMLVHHARKAEAEGLDAVLGTTAIAASVDTVLLLKRDDTAGIRTIASVQRNGTDLAETVLTMNPYTRWVELAGSAAVVKATVVERKILEALGTKSLKEAEIKDAVGGNNKQTGETLRALLRTNRVSRSGKGKKDDPYMYAVAQPVNCEQFEPRKFDSEMLTFPIQGKQASISESPGPKVTKQGVYDIQATTDDDPGEREAIQAEAREAEQAAETCHRRDADPPDLIYSFDTGEVIGAVA